MKMTRNGFSAYVILGRENVRLHQGGGDTGSFRMISTKNDGRFTNSLMLWRSGSHMAQFCVLALSLTRWMTLTSPYLGPSRKMGIIIIPTAQRYCQMR